MILFSHLFERRAGGDNKCNPQVKYLTMKISRSTNNLIEELRNFSGNKLRNSQDISFLIELSSTTKQEKLFDDITFTAKYLNGLGKILRNHMTASLPQNGNTTPDKIDENTMDKIRSEFREYMKKFSLQLTTLIKYTEENYKTDFEDKYLSMNQQSLVNLTTLIYDLSWLKKFKNRKEK